MKAPPGFEALVMPHSGDLVGHPRQVSHFTAGVFPAVLQLFTAVILGFMKRINGRVLC